MRFLALDLGRKHTGIAFADANLGVPVPLETLHHDTVEELVNEAMLLVSQRNIDVLVLGLPLLSGKREGEQASFVRKVAERLEEVCPQCRIEFLDERWTDKISKEEKAVDEHAAAAVRLLQVSLERM